MREELTAAVVWLVDQLFERALEVLQVEVKVDDLVDADRLRHGHRFLDGLNRGVLDLFHGASRNGEHDDEGDLALRARHLEVKPLVLMAEDLHVPALQAAPTDRPVVKPGAVADELDDAHRRRHITPRICEQTALAMTLA